MSIPRLSPGVCQVWWAEATGDDLVGLLDEGEQARWRQFRVAGARALYATAHALARLVVAAHVGVAPHRLRFDATCRHCGGPHGKPAPVTGGVELSLSHSGRHVAVAVAREVAIGIDIEEIALRRDTIPTIALSPAERAALEATAEPRRTEAFIRYWTRKEALVKATGHGLSIGLDGITVSHPDEAPALLAWTATEPRPSVVQLVDLDAPVGYSASLAALGPRPRVTRHDATGLLRAAATGHHGPIRVA